MKRPRLTVDPQRHHLHYATPARRWDEGLPLGNGLLGVLVWGDGRPLNLSLDRSDLWDNRPDPKTRAPEFRWQTLTKLVDRGDMKSLWRIFECSKGRCTPYPTKLPCGRLQLTFGEPVGPFSSHLDFATATATTRLGPATVVTYVHAEQPLVVVRVRGARPRARFLSPFAGARNGGAKTVQLASGNIPGLGYSPLRRGTTAEGIEYTLQHCAGGESYAVAWRAAASRGEWILYATVQRADDGQDPLPLAVRALEDAADAGPRRLEQTHRAWWRNYWRAGHIRLPDPRLEHLWYAEMYKLGACARRNTPPISLQAVWTADEMALPPWRGDYHHDLNSQMSYWPVHTAGRLEQSLGFAEWLRRLLPKYQAFARGFYGAPGANVPGSHGLNGEIVPGWAAYTYSRTNGAWLIQHLWWHYRYTLDEQFLREVAYPFIREQTRFCVSQLTREKDGKYHVRYSSSPEYFHNWRESFATDSTYDLSLIRYALETASRAARILAVDETEAKQWDRLRARLQPYHLSPEQPRWPAPEGGLAIWKGQRLTESHRHLAQCMPIFPLGDLNIEGSERDRQIIENTLSELESMGTGFWCGYSFAWYACLGARIREPRRALWALNSYLDCFVSPNSFHLNGDYKRTGASRFHYRPFTLEGNFGAAHAVNEMLLQSWGDKLRLFPAVPPEWRDVSFTDLRAEGAFAVSAWRRAGEFAGAEIRSERGAILRLEHPHPHRAVLLREAGQGRERRFAPGRLIRIPTRPGGRYALVAAE